METVHNLDQLIKATIHKKAKPIFEVYKTEKKGWLGITTQKEGFYSMRGFSGWEECKQPKYTYVENNTLYYLPHIDYHFSDGSCKTQYFPYLEDAESTHDILLKKYYNISSKI